MPDISMCDGGSCPLRKRCYRFTAKPSEFRQSYFCNPPFRAMKALEHKEDHEVCEEFWDNKERKTGVTISTNKV